MLLKSLSADIELAGAISHTPQISSNAASWYFLQFKFKHNHYYPFYTVCHRLQMKMNVITFQKRSELRILLFWPPLLSGGYDVWGGTHATNPLKTKRIYITFTSYVTEMLETTCFFTVSSWQNRCPIHVRFGWARLAMWMTPKASGQSPHDTSCI